MEEQTFNPRPKNHALPKSLTTVTTFSKILALFLFISLPFLGFYLGFKYNSLLNQASQTPQVVIQKPLPTSVTPSLSLTASPTPTCRPRPACLDATPRCMIAETSDMCPRSNALSPTPGGQSFTGNGCKIGGCSGEICQNQSDQPIASICIYKTSFACYKTARCEKQIDGGCGWTKTPELTSCINNSN
jgi:eight-cysteine-cluster-containing protein